MFDFCFSILSSQLNIAKRSSTPPAPTHRSAPLEIESVPVCGKYRYDDHGD
jgi:hypothetical protein